MKKTPRKLSRGRPAPFLPFALTPLQPAHFTLLLQQHRVPTGEARRIPIEHLPSPRSAILLKIVATETYSANTPRLDRRRQFCRRFRSP